MKDILIAIVILAVLTVLFSVYGTQPTEPTHHADGTRGEQGESETIIPGDEPTELVEPPQSPKTPDYTELAYEVINGDWGNGYTRKCLLREAGYDCVAVQEIVNEILD